MPKAQQRIYPDHCFKWMPGDSAWQGALQEGSWGSRHSMVLGSGSHIMAVMEEDYYKDWPGEVG